MDQEAIATHSTRRSRKQSTPKVAYASKLIGGTPIACKRPHANPLDSGRRKRKRDSISCRLQEPTIDAISTSLDRTIANLNANQDLRAFAVAMADIVNKLQDLLPQYKCKVENCDRRFSRSDSLQIHMDNMKDINHQAAAKKRNTCQFCGRHFRYSGILIIKHEEACGKPSIETNPAAVRTVSSRVKEIIRWNDANDVSARSISLLQDSTEVYIRHSTGPTFDNALAGLEDLETKEYSDRPRQIQQIDPVGTSQSTEVVLPSLNTSSLDPNPGNHRQSCQETADIDPSWAPVVNNLNQPHGHLDISWDAIIDYLQQNPSGDSDVSWDSIVNSLSSSAGTMPDVQYVSWMNKNVSGLADSVTSADLVHASQGFLQSAGMQV